MILGFRLLTRSRRLLCSASPPVNGKAPWLTEPPGRSSRREYPTPAADDRPGGRDKSNGAVTGGFLRDSNWACSIATTVMGGKTKADPQNPLLSRALRQALSFASGDSSVASIKVCRVAAQR